MFKNTLLLFALINLLPLQLMAKTPTSTSDHAKAIEISKEQMAQLLKENPYLKSKKIDLKTLRQIEEEEKKKEKEKERRRRQLENYRSQDYVPTQLNLGGTNGKAALIVFAIIGLVVIVAWVPYAIMGIGRLLNDSESEDLSFVLSTNTSLFENKRIHSQTTTHRGGRDYNFNLSFFLNESEAVQYGLSSEVGYHFIEDELQTGSIEHNALYALTGPSLRIFFDEKRNLAIKLDLMAGASEDNTIGLLSKAQMLLQLYQNNLVLQFGGGSQFIESERTEGPLLNLNSFNLFAVVGVGFNF